MDGALVGISVIDVLPASVSSVYFVWDPDWAWAALGKVSALYELGLVRRMAAAGTGVKWLYMGEFLMLASLELTATGYWIATCPKMLYKGEYEPSFLLDPGTNAWHALTPKLAAYLAAHGGYTPLASIEGMSDGQVAQWKANRQSPAVEDADPEGAGAGSESEDEDDEAEWPTPPPPSFLDPDTIPSPTLAKVMVAISSGGGGGSGGSLMALPYGKFQRYLTTTGRRRVRELVAALGPDMLAAEGRGEEGTKAMLSFD